jgi:hypothetical protein
MGNVIVVLAALIKVLRLWARIIAWLIAYAMPVDRFALLMIWDGYLAFYTHQEKARLLYASTEGISPPTLNQKEDVK